jgi:hypothetical protein
LILKGNLADLTVFIAVGTACESETTPATTDADEKTSKAPTINVWLL